MIDKIKMLNSKKGIKQMSSQRKKEKQTIKKKNKVFKKYEINITEKRAPKWSESIPNE